MRLFLTGGSSYLGQHLVPLALERLQTAGDLVYTYYRHDPLALPQGRSLDVRDEKAVMALLQEARPDVIIHMAGSNRPAETMDAVIRLGATHVARAAAAQGSRLIHISTDVVFDGQHAPYCEEDRPNPIHAYGRAKAAAEAVISAYPRHAIIRTSLIYGLQQMDRGTEWVAAELRAGRPVTLFTDQLRNPVWVQTLSQACLELAEIEYRGILHVAGAQQLSRAEFGQRMLDWWGIAEREQLHFGLGDSRRWPADCTLDTSRARRLLRTPLPGVDEVLQTQQRGRP